MFSDPAVITVGGGVKNLARISTGPSSSTYSNPEGDIVLRVSHQFSKSRTRRMVRLDLTAIRADPLTSASRRYTHSVYLVVDEPAGGITPRADLVDNIGDLCTWLTENTDAMSTKFAGSEI